MNEYAKGGIVIGGTVGAVLLGQWAYKEYFGTGSNDSVLTNAVGNARNALDSSQWRAPFVRVGYPIVNNQGETTDGPVNNSNMDGIYQLAKHVFGDDNSAAMACAFASCESMNGDLVVDCGNCSLFNIHWTSPNVIIAGAGTTELPYTYKGNDKIISFITGAEDQTQGFQRSLFHFKGYLERKAPNALICMRERSWLNFQIEIARINYARSYTNSVSGNTVRDPFIMRRYGRLVNAGRIHAPPP